MSPGNKSGMMWDVTITDTFASCHYPNSSFPTGPIATDASTAKHRT